MENFETNLHEENSFINSHEIKGYLMETSKWGKFLAIVGYIGMGLLVLLAVFMMIGFSALNRTPYAMVPGAAIGFVYIIIAVLYYFPVTYLYRFSTQIKQGILSDDKFTITSGFQNLKSLFKFMGILTIIVLSIYALILLIAIPSAMVFRNF